MRTLPIALLSTLAACATVQPAAGGGDAFALPFLENDLPRALELARQKKLPLFVDAWAPW